MANSTPQSLDDLPEVLTVRQVADYLRVAENSVYSSIRRGEVPSVRLGRRVLVSKAALGRWLDSPAMEETVPDGE